LHSDITIRLLPKETYPFGIGVSVRTSRIAPGRRYLLPPSLEAHVRLEGIDVRTFLYGFPHSNNLILMYYTTFRDKYQFVKNG
jgi:hypothetical protein